MTHSRSVMAARQAGTLLRCSARVVYVPKTDANDAWFVAGAFALAAFERGRLLDVDSLLNGKRLRSGAAVGDRGCAEEVLLDGAIRRRRYVKSVFGTPAPAPAAGAVGVDGDGDSGAGALALTLTLTFALRRTRLPRLGSAPTGDAMRDPNSKTGDSGVATGPTSSGAGAGVAGLSGASGGE